MLTSDIKQFIWQSIKLNKTKLSSLMPLIQRYFPAANLKEVYDYIADLQTKGFIEITDDYIKVKFFLNPPIDLEKLRTGTNFYDYDKIRIAQGEGAVEIPRRWINPMVEHMPDYCDQGDRGTCVGWSMAIGLTILKLTKMFLNGETLPVSINKHRFKELPDKLPCSIEREEYFDEFISPEYIYYMSRIYGGIDKKYASGAYLTDSVPYVQKVGAMLEKDCWTSLTPYCAPFLYPWCWRGKTETAAHENAGALKIVGYSQTTSFETFCRGIYERGVAWIDVNIYENYMDDGCVGCYPFPRGECIGGHAQVAVGYDLDKGEVYIFGSWKRWKGLQGIRKDAWNIVAGLGLIPIDIEMKKVAEKIYTKVYVTSNVDVTFEVDGVKRDETREFSVALESGSVHEIVATPISSMMIVEPRQVWQFEAVGEEIHHDFPFTLVEPSTPTIEKSWVAKIIETIFKKFSWFRK